jgi:hypothetical protein
MLGVRSNWPYHWEQAAFRLNNMKENNLLKPGEFENLQNLLARQPKNKPPENQALQKIVDIRDVHRGPVDSGLVEAAYAGKNQVFEQVKDILPTKAKSEALSSLNKETMIEPVQSDPATRDSILSFVREVRRSDGSIERVLVVGNLSGRPHQLDYNISASTRPYELKGVRTPIASNGSGISFTIPADTCLWIRL